MNSNDFKRINPYLYEIPASYRADMRAPARFYACLLYTSRCV